MSVVGADSGDAPSLDGPGLRTAPDTAGDRRALQYAALATIALAAFGLVARVQIMVMGLARPLSGNIFFRLYALHERLFLLQLALTGAAAALAASRAVRPRPAREPLWVQRLGPPSPRYVVLVSFGVVLATFAIAHLVLHALPFSMDEFSVDFEARLLAVGRYQFLLPAEWRPFGPAITPIFVGYSTSGGWLSVYLPVYAALKAPFVALGARTLLNPLLAGVSVLALAACARRLWPHEGLRPWLAIALCVMSSQFLVTSGSAYSMPAHLCFNLVWLWLYLRGDGRSWGAALLVGVLALGLHNPFPHALFVAPFLVRLLRDRRWDRLGAAVVVYGLGSILWLGWFKLAYSLAQGGGSGLLTLFAVPNRSTFWLHAINLTLLFSWQTPIMLALVIVALARWRSLGPVLTDVAWGIALTLGFFLFFPSTQGHGWGYRYAYQVLGNLSLIAAAGVEPLRRALGDRRAGLLLAGSLALTVAVQLPVRLAQTEQFVRPFAAGVAYVTSRNADVVLVRSDSIWYGRDLIRNDPRLRGQPVVINAPFISAAGRAMLERAHPGRVTEVSNAELRSLGMTPSSP